MPWESERGAPLRTSEDGGQEEELVADRGQGGALPARRETEGLEPYHEVVGEAEDLEVQRVGVEASGGDVAKAVFTIPWNG